MIYDVLCDLCSDGVLDCSGLFVRGGSESY